MLLYAIFNGQRHEGYSDQFGGYWPDSIRTAPSYWPRDLSVAFLLQNNRSDTLTKDQKHKLDHLNNLILHDTFDLSKRVEKAEIVTSLNTDTSLPSAGVGDTIHAGYDPWWPQTMHGIEECCRYHPMPLEKIGTLFKNAAEHDPDEIKPFKIEKGRLIDRALDRFFVASGKTPVRCER